MLVAALLILFLPRKHIAGAFVASALLIPLDQMLLIGPFHFQMLRILIIFGWMAMLIRKFSLGERVFSGGFNALDMTVILCTGAIAVATVALWQDLTSVNNQLGSLYTTFGVYFFLRFFIRNEGDVRRAIQELAYVSAVIALIMLSEQITHRNPYAILGGSRAFVRETLMEREGGLRSLGPFQHPILAGTFGGITLPLFVALWFRDRSARVSALVGVLASTVITVTSQSSTPLLAYAGGVVGLCMWPLRKQMRLIRWGLVIGLTGLHLAMKAPVWALISRIDLTGGSSSYHRFMLVNECIKHFGDWWLVGTKNFADWGWDMWDLANQYVAIADTAGLLPLILFVAILVYGFKYLGRARRKAESSRRRELFFWGLCAALFANCVAFFGIGYWDQTVVAWYLLLAMICAAVATPGAVKSAAAEVEPAMESQKVELATHICLAPGTGVSQLFRQ
jgi:hypothetical protein